MSNWTAPQQDAIDARRGPILVSAAAGSGKTSVLVERAVRLMLDDENPIPADRLLIVTFTNAAAGEMKERISRRLGDLARQNPGDLCITRQQALMGGASIGTIHSFCLELIRQNFQDLPISQDFVLAGEGELELLRQECAGEVIEDFYARGGADFLALVELLSTSRDDGQLTRTLLRLYDFARSHPFYLGWLAETEQLYHDSPPIEETAWGRSLLGHAGRTLEYCAAITEGLLSAIDSDAAAQKAYGSALAGDLLGYRRCLAALQTAGWDSAVEALAQLEFARIGVLKDNEALKARVKVGRERCKKLARALSEKALNATSADFAEDMADLAPKVSALFELCREFDACFTDHKKRKKRLDFSDLEHLALSLLAAPDDKGSYLRTEAAATLACRYGAVLVDEYQDVNEVQSIIFTSVSDKERNLFLVGDAKQSIYSFRLATPAIFLERKAAAFPYHTGQTPAKIILGENFRSRRQVTGAVNYLFSLLMSEQLGDIAYTGEEELACAAQYPEHEKAAAEFLLVDAGGQEGEGEDATAIEADCVARKIEQMIDSKYLVNDRETGRLRPARPGDFCLLLRSPKGRLQTYVNAIEARGMPVSAQGADGFLGLREVSMVVCLLEALDNPLLDISLAAALSSPLFGFVDDDLAAIRLADRSVPFYRALLAVAAGEDKLAARCREFLELFGKVRSRAAVLPADRLLLEIYALTGALAIVGAMPMGESRRQNLLLLVEYAQTYHQMGYKQLGGFVGLLTRLREGGGDLTPAGLTGEGGVGVKVMSVHRSKGLEFPVVILAGTARQFNLQDLNRNTLLHSEYGFACVRREAGILKQYPTIPMQAIRLEARRSTLGEELRVLYVALTRAKEKLIITACPRGNLGKKLGDLAGDIAGGGLNPREAEEARSPMDWLLMALLRHPDGGPLRELAGCKDLEPIAAYTPWHVEVVAPPEKACEAAKMAGISRIVPADPVLFSALQERLAWRYPHRDQISIPAKLAVSALGKRGNESLRRFGSRPRFMGERALTPAERGQAMHSFMQFANYSRARDDLPAEAERLGIGGFLTAAQIESLDLARLRTFFHSPLASRIFAAKEVMRELKFLGSCGEDILSQYLEGMDANSRVALQGVADCVFIEEDGAVILDYKTDRVQTLEQLAERYAFQLRLYRQILAQALSVPIKECILYSFALGAAVEC
ncbi:MAG: helicase-exonuclease AddAB subunit AddA [Oscillospiraceae bacterium]|nr:helicase-exonuclease AddAB subunit AddA [Oscillospiraceae bacterium]